MDAMKALAVAALSLASPVLAAPPSHPPANVSYGDFKALVAEVEPHRQKRLVDLDTFLKMAQEPGVVILDARSAQRYERIHLKGAVNLSFPDFTQADLRKVIPSEETLVLIYCNNNFDGNEGDLTTKIRIADLQMKTGVLRSTLSDPAVQAKPQSQAERDVRVSSASQIQAKERPVSLALNIPTYVTLYGYGYRNVYELDELVKVSDNRVSFEGTVVEKK